MRKVGPADDDWMECVDPRIGRPYFHSHSRKKSTWVPPPQYQPMLQPESSNFGPNLRPPGANNGTFNGTFSGGNENSSPGTPDLASVSSYTVGGTTRSCRSTNEARSGSPYVHDA